MIVVLSLACSSDRIAGPQAGFNHAVVMFACGPADGPATAIYLTPVEYKTGPVPPPSVGIYIDQPLQNLAGQAWDLSIGSDGAIAWYQSDPGTFVRATNGVLLVTSVSSDNAVDGTVDVSIPGLPRITGSIHAVWIPSGVTCP
jgi:hypothetical protein